MKIYSLVSVLLFFECSNALGNGRLQCSFEDTPLRGYMVAVDDYLSTQHKVPRSLEEAGDWIGESLPPNLKRGMVEALVYAKDQSLVSKNLGSKARAKKFGKDFYDRLFKILSRVGQGCDSDDGGLVFHGFLGRLFGTYASSWGVREPRDSTIKSFCQKMELNGDAWMATLFIFQYTSKNGVDISRQDVAHIFQARE